MEEENNIIELDCNLFVFGSLFANYQDFQFWMRKIGLPFQANQSINNINYLFLGNYINYGNDSLLTLITLFSLKI